MTNTIYFDFGELCVYDNFVVAIMNEGITVKPEYNVALENIATEYFKGKFFGYISYRKNSYAVNPLVYLKTSKIENLVAFAVVSEIGIKSSNLEVEKQFLKTPLKHFTDMDEAKDWVNEMINSAP